MNNTLCYFLLGTDENSLLIISFTFSASLST